MCLAGEIDAMVSALPGAAPAVVRRFGVVYVPNGMAMANWTPKTTGAGFELTPILQPLEPVRDQMLVLSGLQGVKGGGVHAGRSTAFLTGVTSGDGRSSSRTGEYELQAGVSADQIAARELGKHTQLGSLELALPQPCTVQACPGKVGTRLTTAPSIVSTASPGPLPAPTPLMATCILPGPQFGSFN